MHIRPLILWTVPAVVVAAGMWYLIQTSGPPPHPALNVILISIDTLRADHLGLYGYERDTSPSIDRLARRSTVFTHAVAQAPNTKPPHASLFTSLYYSVERVLRYLLRPPVANARTRTHDASQMEIILHRYPPR